MLNPELNTGLGIELRWLTDTTFSCRFCLLTRQKNALTITAKKVTEGSLAAVIDTLPKNYPVTLCLSGKGTLHKVISADESLTEEQAFKNAFPGVETSEFYSQVSTEENVSFVSIVRKQLADPLLDTMERAGLKVYNLTLGPAVSAQIWSQLNIYGDTLSFDGHRFNLAADKTLLSYTYNTEFKNDFPVKIGEEVIAEENLVAYASAFQLLLHDKLELIKANADTINLSFKGFLEQGKLKQQGMILIFGVFFLLLISFLVFSSYNAENAELGLKVGSHTADLDNTELLKQNIAENEYLLKQLVWNGGYNYGYLLNEIGSSAPARLALKSTLMNDFKTDEEKLAMQPNIKITGTTDNLTAVNNWIFILKEKPWVKAVKLLQYQQDTESEQYQFSLLLTY